MLDKFKHNIEFKLRYTQVTHNEKTYKKSLIPMAFKLSVSNLNTEDLWTGLKKFENGLITSKEKLTTETITKVEHYRKLVLNPLSHHDINKHEITSEI